MNKIILKGLAFINLYMLISCTKHNEYNAYFYNSSVGKIESEISLYKFKNAFYVCIENQKQKRLISELIIDSIEFKIGKDFYKAKPIKLYYSRKIPSSDFFYPVLNKNHKIEIVSIDNKDMFTLGSVKTNLFNLKEENKILFTEVYKN